MIPSSSSVAATRSGGLELPPCLDLLYQKKLAEMERLLEHPDLAGPAMAAIRSLIIRIELWPRKGHGVEALVYGNLAGMVALAAGESPKTKTPSAGSTGEEVECRWLWRLATDVPCTWIPVSRNQRITMPARGY